MRRTFLFVLAVLVLCLPCAQGSWAGEEVWQPVAGPYGGSVAAVALSPDYAVDHQAFAGLRGQGVYRTFDGGSSWQQASPDGWVVVELAISPAFAADKTLFVTSGLWTSGYSVHRSSDEGDAWEDITPAWGAAPDAPGLAISPDFAADGTLFVLGGTKTYRSTDGGDSFVEMGGWFADHAVAELAFSPAYAADQTLFALVPQEGLYKSTDGGTDWTLTGLSGDYSTFAVSPDYAGDQMLLAVGASSGQLSMSVDGGDTWSSVALVLNPAGQHTLHFSPTFAAADPVILAASSAGPGPYRSEDGGVTWEPVGWYDPAEPYQGGFIGGSVFALALAPDTSYDAAAFAGTSSGIYRSSNWGVNWYQRNEGLARLTVRALAVAPDDPNMMLAGTSFFEHLRFDSSTPDEYDGNLQRSIDGGQTWRDVSGRLDRVQNVIFSPDFANDQVAFAAAGTLGQHGYFDGGVYRSVDGGQNWDEVFGDLICKALAVSPDFATDQTLWVSASDYSSALGLYESVDGGDSWSPLAPAIHATVLVPSPAYAVDRTLFAGTQDAGLQRSTDGGASWAQVLSHPVTALAVSPAYGASQSLYAGVREDPLLPGEIYRSTDGGNTWQQLDTGIPATWEGESLVIHSLAFAYDGSVLAMVYYGHEAGGGAVYRSTDGGETWQGVGSGLEPYSVFALASVPAHSLTFYAGSDGGLWQFDLPQGGPAEPGAWEASGPSGGRAQPLARSPGFASDGVAFAGEWLAGRYADQSGLGIFKSVDGGQTWQSSSSGTEGHSYASAVHDFALSPGFLTDQTVFAATWGGLFKSTDGGGHWSWASRLYSGPPGSVTAVAVAPDYPDSGHVMAVSGWSGLYVSRDGGLTWTAYYTVPATSAVDYSPEFHTDGVAFAGGFGLYKTEDGGTSWTEVLTQSVSSLAVSPGFGSDGTVFVGGDALYISHDAGTSWISVTLPSESPYVRALAVSPDFVTDQTLLAGAGADLYRSNDGGLSWEVVADYPGPAVRSLAFSPGWPSHPFLLVGTDQGVYRTTDGGATWARMQGMTTLTTEPLTLSSDEGLLVAGAYRHGLYGSSDRGGSWFPLGLQEMSSYRFSGVVLSPEYAADGVIFAALVNTQAIGAVIYRTTDGGITWENVYGTGYIGGLAISPQYGSDHTVLAAAEGLVLRSGDGGDSWVSVGDWPPDTYNPARRVALPANYPGDSTLFAAGDGFWRLPPGATTWEPAASGLVAGTSVGDIAVSPNYALDGTLLAAAGWQEEPGGAYHYGVFRSTDGGSHWELANEGLPDVITHHVAFSPRFAANHVAYVTSGDQLYRSLDGGSSWTFVGSVQDTPELFEPVVDSQGDVFVASGTEYAAAGAGVWRYSTPAYDVVINGGFEADSGWELPETAWPAGYSDQAAFDGARSMRIGIDNGGDTLSYSSARQVVSIPGDAISATLRCYVYQVSGESSEVAQAQLFPEGLVTQRPSPSAPGAGDAQYLLLLEPDSGAIVATLFWDLSNGQRWESHTFDLTPYAGQRLRLHLGVYNDGAGGQTGMYADNVSLVVERPAPAGGEYRRYLPLILVDAE